MIKQHSQVTYTLMGICDLLSIAVAWWLAYAVRFSVFTYQELPSNRNVAFNFLIVELVSLIVLAGSGLYKPQRDRSFLNELAQIIKATVVTWVSLIVLIYFSAPGPFTRAMLILFLPLMMGVLIVGRGLSRVILRTLRRRGWNLRHAIIIGTGRLGQSVLMRLHRNSWTGIRIVGFIDADPEATPRDNIRGIPIIGTLATLHETLERVKADAVFIALPTKQAESMRSVVNELEKTHLDVRIIPDLFLSRFPTSVTFYELDGLPILSLREHPLSGWQAIYKRTFDILGALFALLLFSIPMLICAIVIKVQDGGPIFYRQRRISYGHRAFDMIKFRTMVPQAEKNGPAFAVREDPRCTRFGKMLRATSLDELPQLFNVLKGNMSLVGPRPERPEMMDRIRKELPGFPMRLQVRAGLTGWAQVNGFRGRTSFRKRLQYDLYYLHNWSPMLDLRIVFATLVRGFWHPNAH